jgi:hypothetical protein
MRRKALRSVAFNNNNFTNEPIGMRATFSTN